LVISFIYITVNVRPVLNKYNFRYRIIYGTTPFLGVRDSV